MAAETSDIRAQTRRVKKLTLDKAEYVLADPTHPLYNETYLIALKNSIPQTRELTGEDGEAINVNLTKYADNTTALPISTQELPATVVESLR